MEGMTLAVQGADGVHHARKGRANSAGNKGCGTTSQTQAFLVEMGLNPHQLAHTLQPIDLVGAIKAAVIESSSDSPSPGSRREQAASDHTVRARPRFR